MATDVANSESSPLVNVAGEASSDSETDTQANQPPSNKKEEKVPITSSQSSVSVTSGASDKKDETDTQANQTASNKNGANAPITPSISMAFSVASGASSSSSDNKNKTEAVFDKEVKVSTIVISASSPSLTVSVKSETSSDDKSKNDLTETFLENFSEDELKHAWCMSRSEPDPPNSVTPHTKDGLIASLLNTKGLKQRSVQSMAKAHKISVSWPKQYELLANCFRKSHGIEDSDRLFEIHDKPFQTVFDMFNGFGGRIEKVVLFHFFEQMGNYFQDFADEISFPVFYQMLNASAAYVGIKADDKQHQDPQKQKGDSNDEKKGAPPASVLERRCKECQCVHIFAKLCDDCRYPDESKIDGKHDVFACPELRHICRFKFEENKDSNENKINPEKGFFGPKRFWLAPIAGAPAAVAANDQKIDDTTEWIQDELSCDISGERCMYVAAFAAMFLKPKKEDRPLRLAGIFVSELFKLLFFPVVLLSAPILKRCRRHIYADDFLSWERRVFKTLVWAMTILALATKNYVDESMYEISLAVIIPSFVLEALYRTMISAFKHERIEYQTKKRFKLTLSAVKKFTGMDSPVLFGAGRFLNQIMTSSDSDNNKKSVLEYEFDDPCSEGISNLQLQGWQRVPPVTEYGLVPRKRSRGEVFSRTDPLSQMMLALFLGCVHGGIQAIWLAKSWTADAGVNIYFTVNMLVVEAVLVAFFCNHLLRGAVFFLVYGNFMSKMEGYLDGKEATQTWDLTVQQGKKNSPPTISSKKLELSNSIWKMQLRVYSHLKIWADVRRFINDQMQKGDRIFSLAWFQWVSAVAACTFGLLFLGVCGALFFHNWQWDAFGIVGVADASILAFIIACVIYCGASLNDSMASQTFELNRRLYQQRKSVIEADQANKKKEGAQPERSRTDDYLSSNPMIEAVLQYMEKTDRPVTLLGLQASYELLFTFVSVVGSALWAAAQNP